VPVGIRFHPYYTSKDLVGFIGFAILALFVFFSPNYLGHVVPLFTHGLGVPGSSS
jgi:quinol-cytochrome oxidoreductase complex cytochrome b subunit